MSTKSVIDSAMKVAKKCLLRDGYVVPAILFFKGGSMLGDPCPMQDLDADTNISKTKNAFMAGAFARIRKADLVVMVWEGAFRKIDPEKYDETEAPLLYPKSMRTECIIIEGIEVPSGKEEVTIAPYKGGDGEKVEFLPNELDGAGYKSRFVELVVQGWKDFPKLMEKGGL
jgi:hypothetical protein